MYFMAIDLDWLMAAPEINSLDENALLRSEENG